jgi:hypothetical protein
MGKYWYPAKELVVVFLTLFDSNLGKKEQRNSQLSTHTCSLKYY